MAEVQGIDGLLVSMSEFCSCKPEMGRLLAAYLRQNAREDINGEFVEWALACAAEIFSETRRDDQPLVAGEDVEYFSLDGRDRGTTLMWIPDVSWMCSDPSQVSEMDSYLLRWLCTRTLVASH